MWYSIYIERWKHCWLGWLSLTKDRPKTGVVILAIVSVQGSRVVCFAIRKMALSDVESIFNGLRGDNGRSLFTACLVRIGTVPECHGTTILSPYPADKLIYKRPAWKYFHSQALYTTNPVFDVLVANTYKKKDCSQSLYLLQNHAM